MTKRKVVIKNPLSVGAFASHGFTADSSFTDVQDFLDTHSGNRLRVLDYNVQPNPLGVMQAQGTYYCRECRTIASSILQPHLISDCIICNQAATVRPSGTGSTFWNFHRFANSQDCANAVGVVYLFQVPGTTDGIKFGFSYDPEVRAKGNKLYGPMLWKSRVTTRAIARVVELDLHVRVSSGIFDQPNLTPAQLLSSGSSETFKLRSPWTLDSIITHLEGSLNDVESLGWKDYWMTHLDGIDGCPIAADSLLPC